MNLLYVLQHVHAIRGQSSVDKGFTGNETAQAALLSRQVV